MSVLLNQIAPHWAVLGQLFTIRTERDYDGAVERLNQSWTKWAQMNAIRSTGCSTRWVLWCTHTKNSTCGCRRARVQKRWTT